MNDRLRLTALRLFVRVARRGSFSGAGRDLGLSQPSASRLISALEADVGTALVIRTTRAVSLTEAGAQYLLRVESILAALEEADHEVRGTGELRGTLRVAMASSLATREVIPRLPAFLGRYPDLRLELFVDDNRQNLIEDGVDLALRLGVLADPGATTRRIATWRRGLAAAPAYLRTAGVPKSPAELANFKVIIHSVNGISNWSFLKNGRAISVQLQGRLAITLNEGCVAAAVAGLGIIFSGLPTFRREVEQGLLTPVLSDWDMGAVDMHAVFANGVRTKPAARLFADYVAVQLRGAEGLAQGRWHSDG